MVKFEIEYKRGKPFECSDVTKIVYVDDAGEETTVEGDSLLTHRLAIPKSITVFTKNGWSTPDCQGARAISVWNIPDTH